MTNIEERVRDEVRVRPAPQPSDAMLQRILARRAAGERPGSPEERRRAHRTWPWLLPALAAAAAVVLIVRQTDPHDGAVMDSSVARLLGPELLYAEVTDHPAFPVVRAIRQLHPGRWQYNFESRFYRSLKLPQEWLIERSMGEYEGAPAYRYGIGQVLPDRPVALTDTLWLHGETLEPLERSAVNPTGGRVLQLYKEHRVLVGYTTAGGMTSWTSMELDSLGPRVGKEERRMPADLYDIAASIPPWRLQLGAVLESAPLSDDWRGSMAATIALVPWLGLRFWVNFQVVGSETITVPAGTFETWKVQIGKNRNLFAWVSKDRQWLIRLGPDQEKGWNDSQVLVRGESGS
jgi:hypothetical protein